MPRRVIYYVMTCWMVFVYLSLVVTASGSFEPPAPPSDGPPEIVIPPSPPPSSRSPSARLGKDIATIGVDAPPASTEDTSTMDPGAVAGIIIAVVVALVIIAGLGYYFFIRRPEARASASRAPSAQRTTPFENTASQRGGSDWKEKASAPFAAVGAGIAGLVGGGKKKAIPTSQRRPEMQVGSPMQPGKLEEGGNTVHVTPSVALQASSHPPKKMQKSKTFGGTSALTGSVKTALGLKKHKNIRASQIGAPAPRAASTTNVTDGVNLDFYSAVLSAHVDDEDEEESDEGPSASARRGNALARGRGASTNTALRTGAAVGGMASVRAGLKPSGVTSADDTETETLASGRRGQAGGTFPIPAVGSASAASRRQSRRLSAHSMTMDASDSANQNALRGRSATFGAPGMRQQSSLERMVTAAGDRVADADERASPAAQSAAVASAIATAPYQPQPKPFSHKKSFDLPSEKLAKRGSSTGIGKKSAFASFSSRPQSQLLRGNASGPIRTGASATSVGKRNVQSKTSVASSRRSIPNFPDSSSASEVEDEGDMRRRSKDSDDLPPLAFDPALNSAARLAAMLATTPAEAHKDLFRDPPDSPAEPPKRSPLPRKRNSVSSNKSGTSARNLGGGADGKSRERIVPVSSQNALSQLGPLAAPNRSRERLPSKTNLKDGARFDVNRSRDNLLGGALNKSRDRLELTAKGGEDLTRLEALNRSAERLAARTLTAAPGQLMARRPSFSDKPSLVIDATPLQVTTDAPISPASVRSMTLPENLKAPPSEEVALSIADDKKSKPRQSMVIGNRYYRQSTILPPSFMQQQAAPALEGYDLADLLTDEGEDALWSQSRASSPVPESEVEIASDSSKEDGSAQKGKRRSKRVSSAVFEAQGNRNQPKDGPRIIQSKFVAVSESSEEESAQEQDDSERPASSQDQPSGAKTTTTHGDVGGYESDDSDEDFFASNHRRIRASRVLT